MNHTASDATIDTNRACPPWCTRNHRGIRHGGAVAEGHVGGMTVTVELGWHQQFDGSPTPGPHASIDITVDGMNVEFDLTHWQAQLLARVLTVDGGAEWMAEGLTQAATALAATVANDCSSP